ncbi:MAG: hypothetical protein ACYTGZ_05200 [Planctomycetota bacterium]|jgi:outer membrane protein assembly factor BamD (BamD/ComL family)
MKRIRNLPLAMLTAILIPMFGCSSTPDLSADEAANQVAEHLAKGNVKDANELFDDLEDSDHHRETVYAVVYSRAGDYYRKGQWSAAARNLRFLHEFYPDAAAPRMALLSALLQQRAAQSRAPDGKQVKEMKGLVKEIRKADENAPAWVYLAAAQAAVDEGRIDHARKEYSTFKSKWDGKPRELRAYTTEFERYFESVDKGEA